MNAPEPADHPVTSSPRHPVINLGRLGRLVRKEVTETLRDRRTLVTLILMPLLLYPLMGIAFQTFLMGSSVSRRQPAFRLGFRSEAEAGEVSNYLSLGRQTLEGQGQSPLGPDGSPLPEPRLVSFIAENLKEDVSEGRIDLGFRPARPEPAGKRTDGETALDWELLYRKDSVQGREAFTYVQRVLGAANAELLSRRLREAGVSPRPALLRPRAVAVEAPKDSGSVSLAALIPLVLILMTITGAVYPAIDLTAGERERGTLEVLVAAPVPRLSLLIAKYVAVLTVAVLTALINLTVMTATLLITGLGPMIFGPGGLSLLVMAEVFGLLLLFAAFFAAVLLALTSFARSFKEAQAYLIPLMLVSLVPGLLALLPGLKLEGTLTVAPLLNIVLLGRDLLEGQAHLTAAAVVVVSTFLYALAALALAARIFGAEAVLYSESGGWLSLFRRG